MNKRQNWLPFFLTLFAGGMMHSSAAYSQEIGSDIEEFFASCTGSWDAVLRNWGTDDTTKPDSWSGTVMCSRFGESWLVSEMTLENEAKSRWTLGYSGSDQTFSGVSIVNFSPHMKHQTGAYESKTKTLSLLTKDKDVISGEKSEGKIELKIVDKTERIVLMFSKDKTTGEFSRNCEVVYKRRIEKKDKKD